MFNSSNSVPYKSLRREFNLEYFKLKTTDMGKLDKDLWENVDAKVTDFNQEFAKKGGKYVIYSWLSKTIVAKYFGANSSGSALVDPDDPEAELVIEKLNSLENAFATVSVLPVLKTGIVDDTEYESLSTIEQLTYAIRYGIYRLKQIASVQISGDKVNMVAANSEQLERVFNKHNEILRDTNLESLTGNNKLYVAQVDLWLHALGMVTEGMDDINSPEDCKEAILQVMGTTENSIRSKVSKNEKLSTREEIAALAYDHPASVAKYLSHQSMFPNVNNADIYYIGRPERKYTSVDNEVLRSKWIEFETEYNACSRLGGETPEGRASTIGIRFKVISQLADVGAYAEVISEGMATDPRLNFVQKDIIDQCGLTAKEIVFCADWLIMSENDYVQKYNYLKTIPAGDWFAYELGLLAEARIVGYLYGEQLVKVALARGQIARGQYAMALDALSNIRFLFEYLLCETSQAAWYTPYLVRHDTSIEGETYSPIDITLEDIYQICLKAGLLNASDYLDYYWDNNRPLTYFWIANEVGAEFSGYWQQGRGLSSAYIPMQTNVYDPYAMIDLVDTEWIDYHYKWGFHRKALMIDTGSDAAQAYYVNHSHGQLRIATLQDLLNCESEIVLYIDDNFYNADAVAELQDKSYGVYGATAGSDENNIFHNIGSWMSIFNDLDIPTIVKTGEHTQYSLDIANNVKTMDEEVTEDEQSSWFSYESQIMAPDDIRRQFMKSEYSELTTFAFVSNIYREKESFALITSITGKEYPVFVSSATVPTLVDASEEEMAVIYNYALLKNLKGMMTVGYETNLDITSPLYMDLYGNILTESGLVVVSAASNATLHNVENYYSEANVGFLSSYGTEWKIPLDWNLSEEFMTYFFIPNKEDNVWDIRPMTIDGTGMNWAALSYSSATVKKALINYYLFDVINSGQVNLYKNMNIIHEVVRGAPIEYIDPAKEGINGTTIDRSGVIAAAKLDALINELDWDDENSIMSVPTLEYLDNYELIVTIVFKVLLIIIIVMLMVTLFTDIIKSRVSWRTFFSCLKTLLIGVGSVLLIPVMFNVSYYQSNKYLLQDEAEYISMFNAEKVMAGVEIGTTEIKETAKQTKILLKLDSYQFDWWANLDKVIFGDSVTVMKNAYKDYLTDTPLSDFSNIQLKNDGAYIDIQDIYDTTYIDFISRTKMMRSITSEDPVASYYIPYYYFQDAIIASLNNYNASHNIYMYSTKVMRGGRVKTVNLSTPYFTSPEFMEEGSDFLGLYQLYDNVEGSVVYGNVFEESAIEPARKSQWYVGTQLSDEEILKRIDKVHQHMREFVNNNRNVLGKITDETFIKSLAMSTAMYYNRIFGIPSANEFEVYQLSNADLLRLSISDRDTTLETSPLSFSRFILTNSGVVGTYAGVFLVIITMFTAIAKTVLTIVILALLITSIYVQKIILQKENKSVVGYIITLLVICSANVLYAIFIKCVMLVPATGLSPTLCILLQIIVQIGYLLILSLTVVFAIRDWKNIGYSFYEVGISGIKNKFKSMFSGFGNRAPRTAGAGGDMSASDIMSAQPGDYRQPKHGFTDDARREKQLAIKRKKSGHDNLD